MATVKIVLRKKQVKNGSYPIAIRITKDRKSSYIHLGQYLKESDWDPVQQRVRKSFPNSVRLNNFLIAKLAEATDKSLEVATSQKTFTAKSISQKIKPKAGDTVFGQADLYISRLKEDGKYKPPFVEKNLKAVNMPLKLSSETIQVIKH